MLCVLKKKKKNRGYTHGAKSQGSWASPSNAWPTNEVLGSQQATMIQEEWGWGLMQCSGKLRTLHT